MIGRQFMAIVRLRWQLASRRWRRNTVIGTIVSIAITIAALIAALLGFTIALVVGLQVLPKADPDHVLVIWDGVVIAFLFFWAMGVITELQRTEALSLDKLLHLPVSLRGAFLLNYVSSLLSLALIVFGSLMAGLTVALVIVKGPMMLLLVPLVVSFMIMVTAVTYQFRGWLATLMANKRRRGTIIAVITLGLISLAQLPNLYLLGGTNGDERQTETASQIEAIRSRGEAGELTPNEVHTQITEVRRQEHELRRQRRRERFERALDLAYTANLVVPVGWLPYGARSAAQHRPWPALLGTLGALVIGALSLARSYSTTMRLYTGALGARRRPKAPRAKRDQAAPAKRRPLLLARRLPGCPERAAAVALASFRSLVRAPQAKLLLMTPIIMLVIFGILLFGRRSSELPAPVPPLLALGAVILAVFCLAQLLQNVFGFDRDGFRTLVLCSAPRWEILLGKNLANAPFVFGLGGLGVIAVTILAGLHWTHLVASLLQLLCVYLICCIVGNLISIIAPMAMAAGTLKPAHPKAMTVLKHAVFAMLFPIAMIPTVLPLGLELLLDHLERGDGIPLYLLGSAIEVPVVLWLYRWALRGQGRLLQQSEQRVLEEVTRTE